MRTLFLMTLLWGTMPLFFIDPFYGIVHYSLINIIRPEQLLWGNKAAVGRIFLGSQAMAFAAWFVNKDKLTPEYTPVPTQLKIQLVTALMMALTCLTAYNQAWSWRWTTGFFKTTLFCFVMSKSINTAKKLERYYAVSLVWLMLLQMWGIQQKLGGNVRMEGLGGDQLGDVNDLASVAIMYFPMAYYSIFSKTKWIKFFIGIPTTIISVIFILFGGSRGAFLGLIGCTAFIFLRTPGFVSKLKMVVTVCVLGALLILVLGQLAPEGFFDEYTNRLSTILGNEDEHSGEVEREGSSAGRIAMWKAAYYLFKQHPEFWPMGVGMFGFPNIYFQYIDEIAPYLSEEELHHIYFGGGGGKAIHNTFINVMTGGGLIVSIPWLLLLFCSWWQVHTFPQKYPKIVDGLDLHNYARALEVGMFGAGITISFINAEFVDFYYWHLTMTSILVNLGKGKLKREELGQDDEEFERRNFSRSAIYV